MDHAPRALRAYVLVLGTVGLLLVGAALGGQFGEISSTYRVVLPLAAILVELAPARLRSGVTVSLVTVVIFAAILLAGPGGAVLAAAGNGVGSLLRMRERRLERAAFNLGQMVLAALAAGVVYESLGRPDTLLNLASPLGLGLVQLALTSLVLSLCNMVFISGIVWCIDGESPRQTFSGFIGSAAPLQFVYVLLAVIAAVLVTEVHAVALVVLLVPLMVARAGLLGFQEQDEATDRMVKAFVKALEVKDGYTRGHAERVAGLTEKVAAEMGFSYEERRMAGYAALLHDIGKIGVPTAVITKRGPLDDEEFAAIKRHPTVGAEMLRDIDFLVPALDVVRHHHERYDGRGYPYGLAGERIPPLARMVSVVDAFDAMTSTRSYRKALPVDVALRELDRCAGTQFDVDAVKALHHVIEREGWELTTDPVGEVVSRAGQVRALAREVVSEAAG
jgi:putative nucleotidyltransferase with HDIG domain